MTMSSVRNIRIAGLGGMGILKSSEILAEVLFHAGYDVKKAEVHGMSQRGGSVASDIRFGDKVLSPMIPDGETDYLLVLAEDELPLYTTALRPAGILISPKTFAQHPLPNKKCLNIAMLGALNFHLAMPVDPWASAICLALPAKAHAVNLDAFRLGMEAGGTTFHEVRP